MSSVKLLNVAGFYQTLSIDVLCSLPTLFGAFFFVNNQLNLVSENDLSCSLSRAYPELLACECSQLSKIKVR